MMEYHAYRAVDDVRETYSDLVIVYDNCQSVLSMKPDISQSPEAEKNWNKIKEGVINIMTNSMVRANKISKAGM